jgi:tetratricopeptide (TPR) repeat protein
MTPRFHRTLPVVLLLAFLFTSSLAGEAGVQQPSGGRKPPPAGSATKDPAEAVSKLGALADKAREEGRFDDALGLYFEALELDPAWAEGWWYVGTIHYDLYQYKGAREAFRRLIALQPEYGPGYAYAGLCEFELGRYEAAVDHLHRAGALGFSDHKELRDVSRYHLGAALTRLEQYEVALSMLNSFAVEGNESTRVIEAMGLALLRMPLLASELPAERREMVLMAGRANFYAARRLTVAARRTFEELAHRFPEAPNVNYAYGTFLVIEEPETGLDILRRELAISPGHVHAKLQIAFEYLKRSDFEAALPYAREAVEAAPSLFPARKAYGDALLGVGDVQAAIEQLEAGVKMADDSPGMRFSLARAYARAGRTEEAARERAEFLRLDKISRTGRTGAQSVGGLADQVDGPPQ